MLEIMGVQYAVGGMSEVGQHAERVLDAIDGKFGLWVASYPKVRPHQSLPDD